MESEIGLSTLHLSPGKACAPLARPPQPLHGVHFLSGRKFQDSLESLPISRQTAQSYSSLTSHEPVTVYQPVPPPSRRLTSYLPILLLLALWPVRRVTVGSYTRQ